MKFLIFIALFFSNYAAMGISAIRPAGVSAELFLIEEKNNINTAVKLRKPYSEITGLPWKEWTLSDTELVRAFKEIRDERFLSGDEYLQLRRPTWLYPDDGCHIRAEIAARRLLEKGFPEPVKVFVFGNLELISDYTSPNYSATWWFHVAIGYKFKDEYLIFDPSVQPKGPTTLKKWAARFSKPHFNTYAVCNVHTLNPHFDCINSAPNFIEITILDQSYYFKPEWNRLIERNKDPSKELGDDPPWK